MKYIIFFAIICSHYYLNNFPTVVPNIKSIDSCDSTRKNVFVKSHVFKDKNEKLLGTMYINFINDELFQSLIIIGKIKTDTLYKIDEYSFKNRNGIDWEVNSNSSDGYKIVLKKNDYLKICLFTYDGLSVSDALTIEWNYKSNLFEVLILP